MTALNAYSATATSSVCEQTIGTCSLCGGPVKIPVVWWGVTDPTPTCRQCGATPTPNHGPVIPMHHGVGWTTGTYAAPPDPQLPDKGALQRMLKDFEKTCASSKSKPRKKKRGRR